MYIGADLPNALLQISWSISLDGVGSINNNVKVFSNGTLVISLVSQYHSGRYTCSAEYDGEIIVAPVVIIG